MTEFSRAQEIAQVEVSRPHVLILGAGASRAAFPKGDKFGKRLPLMADFDAVLPIGDLLRRAGFDDRGQNFEKTYSTLVASAQHQVICSELEEIVCSYFDSLVLPNHVTIYDHLILSLRPKDVIATFNWDPFLIDTVRRHQTVRKGPTILFLHGNVRAGYCEADSVHGVVGARCSECGSRFSRTPLLFPTAEKNYDRDPEIADAWRAMKVALERAFMVTVFGYSAPASDVAAVEALMAAWGGWRDRELEQFEFIDIRPEDEVIDSWSDFVHTHHYDYHKNVYESWILNHPRRTGEAWKNQYLNVCFIEDNPVPRDLSVGELTSWYGRLLEAEEDAT